MGAWYYTSCCIQWNCQMHIIAHFQICSEVHFWFQLIVHSQPAWLTLQIMLSRCFQVHFQACSQGHSQLNSMAPSQPFYQRLQRCAQLHSQTRPQVHIQVPKNEKICSRLYSRVLNADSCCVAQFRHWEMGGCWQGAAAEIVMSVDVDLWTIFLVQPLWWALPISHCQSVCYSHCIFFNVGRQLDLGESRSLT